MWAWLPHRQYAPGLSHVCMHMYTYTQGGREITIYSPIHGFRGDTASLYCPK